METDLKKKKETEVPATFCGIKQEEKMAAAPPCPSTTPSLRLPKRTESRGCLEKVGRPLVPAFIAETSRSAFVNSRPTEAQLTTRHGKQPAE
jgi:hypothetical protein